MTLKPKAELVADLNDLIGQNIERLEGIQEDLDMSGDINECAWELHRALEESLAINNLAILIGWMDYTDAT